jgi:hypothetical protein
MQCMQFLKIISRDASVILLQRQVAHISRYLALIPDKNLEKLGSFEFISYLCGIMTIT